MNEHSAVPVTMTEEQKFFFDLQGWILLPSVLSEAEIAAMKAEVYGGAKQGYQGALQELLDHPAVAGILTEILAEPSRTSGTITTASAAKIPLSRCDTLAGKATRAPACRMWCGPPQQANAMRYQVAGNKIFSGLTRVVWELEEVKAGQGGTTFLSGSHKAHFNYGGPDPNRPNIGESPWEEPMRAAMAQYSCPPGSAIVFTESLLHAANDWLNPDNPRCAVFNCYNSLWAQWHRLNLSHEIIEAMPPKRRSLFRGIWQIGGDNRAYALDNRSV